MKIDDLLRAWKRTGTAMNREGLEALVRADEKQRFTIRGAWIRAAQGHSVEIGLGLEPREPPRVLYHGTASQNLDSIFAVGLLPGRRRQVHLSSDAETAAMVGRRHGKTIVLRVDARRMHDEGHQFFIADNGVWLTDQVPKDYLGFGVGRCPTL